MKCSPQRVWSDGKRVIRGTALFWSLTAHSGHSTPVTTCPGPYSVGTLSSALLGAKSFQTIDVDLGRGGCWHLHPAYHAKPAFKRLRSKAYLRTSGAIK